MIANKSKFSKSGLIETMAPEALIDLMIKADLPLLEPDVASRVVNSDPVSLQRLAFLAMLSGNAEPLAPVA